MKVMQPIADGAFMAKRSWRRLDGVDGLRALAIFTVLMNHINMRLFFAMRGYLHGLPRQLADSLVWQGQAGVQIFFAVSGFLITATSVRRWGDLRCIRLREFYLLRFARIAPLFLTLLAVLSLLHALHLRDFRISEKTGGLPGALIAALTLRIGLLEATKGYLPGNWDILWSLSVEELFYLFFPLACRWLGGGRGLILFLAVFVVLGPFGRTVFTHGNETWQEYSYLGGMDAIALGCLTAIVTARQALRRRTVQLCFAGGMAILIFCLGFSREVYRLGFSRVGLGMTLLAAGACLLIAAAAETQWKAPRLLAPVLAYGRRSYEVYLTHMFVVFACFDVFLRAGHQPRWIPVLFLATLAFAGVLGALVGRYASEPVNLWLRARFGEPAKKIGSVLLEA